ncbi:MAG TPA: GNAT family N-acetyltransferase [Candidatus Woesebacteria bacterium]|nr:GNAT family N-acetyltransferase [Candidatus Woesebacteria bacterium]
MQKDQIDIRRPTSDDVPGMLALIHFVHGDDTDIDLSTCMVAIYEQRVIGVVRIKTLPDGIHRLASLGVYAEYRRYGVGSALLAKLFEAHHERPVYVLCTPQLHAFYTGAGFVDVEKQDLPSVLHEEYDRMTLHAPSSTRAGVLSMVLES